jgi:Fanconi anemia group M protein
MDAMKDLVRRGAPAPKLVKLEEILDDHFEKHDPARTRVIIFSDRRESVK